MSECVTIKVMKKNGVNLPKMMTQGASGMDVYAYISESVTLKPLERQLIPTGIHVEIPIGYEIQVRPRSGLAIKHGITLLNTPGTIDADYRGEIQIILVNLSSEIYVIEPQERIAQFVLQKVSQIHWEEVLSVETTDRNSGGFGHTGRN